MGTSLVAVINVPDDYETGNCENCPLCAKSYFENHYIQENISCKIGFTSLSCPLIVKHINVKEGGKESDKNIN